VFLLFLSCNLRIRLPDSHVSSPVIERLVESWVFTRNMPPYLTNLALLLFDIAIKLVESREVIQ
jgi:hypothetical protein